MSLSADLSALSATAASLETEVAQVAPLQAQVADLQQKLAAATRPPPVPTMVDLIATGLHWSPVAPKVGDKVTFSVDLKNIGTADVVTGANPQTSGVGIAFTVNGVHVVWSGPAAGVTIPAGGTRSFVSNGGPAGVATWTAAAAGTFVVGAIVDDVNRIVEGNETNNTLTASMVVTPAVVTPPPPAPTGAQTFKSIFGAYTEAGSAGQQITDLFLAFEAIYGPMSTVVTMADTRKQVVDDSMWGTYGVSQTDGWHRWTAALAGNRKFVVTWPSSWAEDGSADNNEQNLAEALTDQFHLDMIKASAVYMRPVFGDGHNLIIRMPHEFEPNWYTWGLARDPQNTPANMIAQHKRQVAAWKAEFPKCRIEVCCAAGVNVPGRWTVLDGILDYVDIIACDLYDANATAPAFADAKLIFDYAKAHGKRIAVTETGAWTNGDNPAFIDTLWNLMKQYDVEHLCWFESGAQGDHRLSTHPKMAQRIKELLAAG